MAMVESKLQNGVHDALTVVRMKSAWCVALTSLEVLVYVNGERPSTSHDFYAICRMTPYKQSSNRPASQLCANLHNIFHCYKLATFII